MNYTNEGNDLTQKVQYYIALPSYKTSHGFPETLSVDGKRMPLTTGELTDKINAAFLPEGKSLRPEYFMKGSGIDGNLAYLVLGLDEKQNYNLAEGLIAKKIEINGITVIVYDIIFVTPPYQKQGHMPKLVGVAGMIENSNKKQPKVAILRTKSDYAHSQYSKISDKSDEVDGFKVHGFGFFNKDGTEKFEGAKTLFDKSAIGLASRPENFYPIR